MKINLVNRRLVLLLHFICMVMVHSRAECITNTDSGIVLVGSTPGDSLIKSLLNINHRTNIDFIRWELTLDRSGSGKNKFILNINFGESKPNTMGFIGGGERRIYLGTYSRRKAADGKIIREILDLNSGSFSSDISLVRLDENSYHFVTKINRLLIGNGGWSYMLFRNPETGDDSKLSPFLVNSRTFMQETAVQSTYDGRTPCTEFADEFKIKTPPDCFKIKWRLVLNRDAKTGKPSTYILKNHIGGWEISGVWDIKKGKSSDPEFVILRLNPEDPKKTISFLAGDENILFFLHKNNLLFKGNKDFGIALSRKI